MRIFLWMANILGWPIIHFAISKLTLALSLERFAGDHFLYTGRSWEQDGNFYRKWLLIRRWKPRLPDGAPWLGGFSKKRLASHDPAYLRTFLLETRRAEFAHWCTLLCAPVFFLWNPPWACAVMAAYAVLANLPCILAQRYNRLVLARLLHKRA